MSKVTRGQAVWIESLELLKHWYRLGYLQVPFGVLETAEMLLWFCAFLLNTQRYTYVLLIEEVFISLFILWFVNEELYLTKKQILNS